MGDAEPYVVEHTYRNPPLTGEIQEGTTSVVAHDPLDAIFQARTHCQQDTASEWIRAFEVRRTGASEPAVESDLRTPREGGGDGY